MNNAKMWLVVSPTVGVPIFLGAVAVGSFAVHLQVVKNTTWVSDFLQGSATAEAADDTAMLQQFEAETQPAAFVMPADGNMEVMVILPDGTSTTAILQMPGTDVSYDAGEAPPLVTY